MSLSNLLEGLLSWRKAIHGKKSRGKWDLKIVCLILTHNKRSSAIVIIARSVKKSKIFFSQNSRPPPTIQKLLTKDLFLSFQWFLASGFLFGKLEWGKWKFFVSDKTFFPSERLEWKLLTSYITFSSSRQRLFGLCLVQRWELYGWARNSNKYSLLLIIKTSVCVRYSCYRPENL